MQSGDVSEPGPCLVLLGGPGSGKGTHGQAIADALHLAHISTGALFRREIEQRTPLGILAKEHIDNGQLVPDEATLRMVSQVLKALPSHRGFILDGYPRSSGQARDLDALLETQAKQLAGALCLHVSDLEILRRLAGRLTCKKCQKTFHRESHPPAQPGICPACGGTLYQREDDNPESIRKRLVLFHQLNKPLLAYYRNQKKLREINAEGPRPEVQASALQAVRQMIS